MLDTSIEVLLENLHLTTDGYLKQACALLFYSNPEKYFTGAYIKIGFFKTDADLIYQDEVHGNLFDQVDKAMDLLLTKYMSATISYQNIDRVEVYPYPKEALREALLNAVAHKDYSSGIPIQISVYGDKLIIWNEGQLPLNWTIETILAKHPSKPANPDVANTFFRAGMIESWGRGISKIIDYCLEANLKEPTFNTGFGGLMITFSANIAKGSERSSEKTTQKTTQKTEERILEILTINPKASRNELAEILGDITEDGVKYQLNSLKTQGKIERIGSDKGGYWKVNI